MQTSQIQSQVMDKASQVKDQLDQLGNPRSEGFITKRVEEQTAKIPSIAFLMLGGASILASIGLRAMGKGPAANFVGLWTPTILIMGLYNKLVKVEGSERDSDEPRAGGRQSFDRSANSTSSTSSGYTM